MLVLINSNMDNTLPQFVRLLLTSKRISPCIFVCTLKKGGIESDLITLVLNACKATFTPRNYCALFTVNSAHTRGGSLEIKLKISRLKA